MHIHGNHINTQLTALAASQSTQRAAESKKAAAEVRRKLGIFASAADYDRVSEVESDSSPDSHQEQQPEADSFKHFFSATV